MFYRRLLPDRSSVMLLAIAVTAALTLLGFGNLVIIRRDALTEQQQVRQQLEVRQEQNRMLLSALEKAQHRQNIAPRAYEYYHRLPPGLIIFEEQPVEGAVTAHPGGANGPALWMQFVERLRLTLTNP
jgi:outer membrane PBP1 activator LpoA protein